MESKFRSFSSLKSVDFEDHPVWLRVRSFDFEASWYDRVDDETFRVWDGSLPFAEPRGMVLVTAKMRFNDGSVFPGFLTPAKEDWDAPLLPRMVNGRLIQPLTPKDRHGGSAIAILGIQQPRIFLQDRMFPFWGGMVGIREETRKAFYESSGKQADQIFPIAFYSDPQLAVGIISGQVDGFYKSVRDGIPRSST